MLYMFVTDDGSNAYTSLKRRYTGVSSFLGMLVLMKTDLNKTRVGLYVHDTYTALNLMFCMAVD